jgi:hypothetical protein
MNNLHPWLRPLAGPADLERLAAAARADNHIVVGPSHVIDRGGEVVGYASLGVVPMLHTWVATGKVGPRESLGLLNCGEMLLANLGHRHVILPCAETSPFWPHIERLGYVKLGVTTLNIKQLQ